MNRRGWLRVGVAASALFAVGSVLTAGQALMAQSGGGRTEYCFGAIGPGCVGAPFASPRKLSNGRWVMKVAVGSILHDNCCLKKPNGKWCGKHAEVGHDGNCDKEWNKAVWNTQPSDNRTWEVEFDPKAAADLTPVSNPRRSVFAKNYQNGGTWSGPEVAASRKLAAPKGTNLDVGDQAFCASGRATSPQSSFGKEWITCL